MTTKGVDVTTQPMIYRTTVHQHFLEPGDPRVLVDRQFVKKSAKFRVTRITETVREFRDGTMQYRVLFTGPVVTSTGADHASRTGDREWYGTDICDPGYPFPQALAHLLLGAQRLVDARRIPGGWTA